MSQVAPPTPVLHPTGAARSCQETRSSWPGPSSRAPTSVRQEAATPPPARRPRAANFPGKPSQVSRSPAKEFGAAEKELRAVPKNLRPANFNSEPSEEIRGPAKELGAREKELAAVRRNSEPRQRIVGRRERTLARAKELAALRRNSRPCQRIRRRQETSEGSAKNLEALPRNSAAPHELAGLRQGSRCLLEDGRALPRISAPRRGLPSPRKPWRCPPTGWHARARLFQRSEKTGPARERLERLIKGWDGSRGVGGSRTGFVKALGFHGEGARWLPRRGKGSGSRFAWHLHAWAAWAGYPEGRGVAPSFRGFSERSTRL
jgi:hypothetical protein